jgi:hypothetical protein
MEHKKMKKSGIKKLSVVLATVLTVCVMLGCNQPKQKSGETVTEQETSLKMKIGNVNTDTGAFDFIDVRTGEKLSYNKLMIDSLDVERTYWEDMLKAVVFVYTDSSAGINKKNNKGYTTNAVIEYELNNGVLKMIANLPKSPAIAEEKIIRLESGACIYEGLEYSMSEKCLKIHFTYTVKDGADTDALIALLSKGTIVSSEGKTYKSPRTFSNRELSVCKLEYDFPDAINENTSIKYVLNGQEIRVIENGSPVGKNN